MHRFFWGLLLAFLLSSLAAFAEAPPPYKIIHRDLGPCKISLAEPAHWNGQVLFLAHGLRDEESPLTAEFDANAPYYQTLLKEGWLLAATSYRRNGYLVEEGIDDLAALRSFVIKTYGKPKRMLIEGTGLGGALAARIAEAQKGQYDGVLALGAQLYLGSSEYRFIPQIPLLFLSTSDEISGPHSYVAKAAELKAPLPPVVWRVNRKVGNQFFDDEKLAAFRGLLAFCDTGKSEGEKDVTGAPPSVAVFENGGARAPVTLVTRYGHINTAFSAPDLAKLGLALGSRLTVTCRGKSVTALYGTTYNDVPAGEWVVFIKEDAYLRISRNWANAAEILGCTEGDDLFITPAPTPPPQGK